MVLISLYRVNQDVWLPAIKTIVLTLCLLSYASTGVNTALAANFSSQSPTKEKQEYVDRMNTDYLSLSEILPITHAIGKLTGPGMRNKICTAMLIKDALLLTANHCIPHTHRAAIARGITFSLATCAELKCDQKHVVRIAKLITRGGHPIGEKAKLGEVSQDWILLQLERSIITPEQPAFIDLRPDELNAELEKGGSIFGIGYGNSNRQLSMQNSCSHKRAKLITRSIATLEMRAFVTSCDVRFGDSGGPLILRRADGTLAIIGLCVGRLDFGAKLKPAGISIPIENIPLIWENQS